MATVGVIRVSSASPSQLTRNPTYCGSCRAWRVPPKSVLRHPEAQPPWRHRDPNRTISWPARLHMDIPLIRASDESSCPTTELIVHAPLPGLEGTLPLHRPAVRRPAKN